MLWLILIHKWDKKTLATGRERNKSQNELSFTFDKFVITMKIKTCVIS